MQSQFQPFFKAALSVDNVIFGFDDNRLKVLLIKRGEVPYRDFWALPGNLVFEDEELEEAAQRVLYELTSLKDVYLEQVKAFGAVDRHPIGRVVTVAYYSLIRIPDDELPKPRISFASEAQWFDIREVPHLAFDHDFILASSIRRLQRKVRTQPIGFELLPQQFTLSELQLLYEAILQTPMEKRNFRKKIMALDVLEDVGVSQAGVAHRPARLFAFNAIKYRELVEQGLSFKL
jgi:8-oxo-dGTP diphosphatase